jgi:hypothetical protein
MTSRSSFVSKCRPLSAIFLGDGPAALSTSSTFELPNFQSLPALELRLHISLLLQSTSQEVAARMTVDLHRSSLRPL